MQQAQNYTEGSVPVNAFSKGSAQLRKHICTVQTVNGPVRVCGDFSEVMKMVHTTLAAMSTRRIPYPS